jgi:hypothetical protein
MNKPFCPRRSLFAAVSLFAASASTLFAAAPSLDRLVPADTAVVVSVRDLPALNARSADTSFMRAWTDPEIARFFAPLREHPKLTAFLAELKAETGLTLDEMGDLLTGDVLFAMPKVDFDNAGVPSLFLAFEVGENQSRIADLIATATAKTKATIAREDYNGVELVTTTASAEDAEEEPGSETFWALHEGRWLIGSNRAAVTDALDALAAGGLARPLAESPDYLRLLDRAPGTPEMLAHVNFRAIYPALIASVEAKRDPNAAPNMFGIEPVAVMKALGLDVIEGLSMVASHKEGTDYFSAALNYTEDRGIVRFLAYKDGPVAKPDWMPAAWFNVSSQNFSLADFYTEIETVLARVSPLLAGMAQGQVQAFERKLGINLKRDLFGSLGHSFISGFADPAGVNAEKATPYDELDQMIAISLADQAVFERALDAIKGAFLPPGAASPLQSREYLGRTIHSVASPMPGAKSFCYAISDGWLLMGIGSAGTVESAIQLQVTPNSDLSFWRRADARAATDGAPKRAVSLQYTELPPLLASLAALFVKMQEAQGDDEARFVDPAAQPSRELLGRYFKHAAAYSVRTSEGLIIHSEGPSK